MRRKDREVTDKNTIAEILSKSEICRIAINDDNGYTYIVPLNYGYCDNSLYFHCAKDGKKIDLIRLNNKVGFEIENFSRIIKNDQPCKWSMHYLSLVGTGEVEIIEDTAGKKKGLDIIMNHYGKATGNEYVESHVNNIVILKLNITGLTAKGNGEREVLTN